MYSFISIKKKCPKCGKTYMSNPDKPSIAGSDCPYCHGLGKGRKKITYR